MTIIPPPEQIGRKRFTMIASTFVLSIILVIVGCLSLGLGLYYALVHGLVAAPLWPFLLTSLAFAASKGLALLGNRIIKKHSS